MPAGIMIPAIARQMTTSMIGGSGFGSSSGLTLGQPNMITYQLNPLDMADSTAESDVVGRVRDEEFDSKSGSENHEGGSGDEQDLNQRPKKKRYHRHTQHQIEEMEAFFKECPHPDDKQRKELSRELGLEPLQIKFWFQNKRTQMKMQHERHENTALRNENEKLRSDNMRYREALGNASCPNCGDPTVLGEMSFEDQHLSVENSRLREEIDRISAIAAKYVGKPVANYPIVSPPITQRSLEFENFGGELYSAGDLLRSIGGPSEQADKQMIVELAVAAMEELTRMAQMGEPLWIPGIDSTYLLNEDEYFRIFPRGIGSKPLGFRSEASSESAVVIMNHTTLIEILMDANQWSTLFSGVVSRAMTLEVLSTGVAGNFNGALQVMTAEFHVLSPVVPTRESYFVRYCKQHVDGNWAVVDVSLDSLRPNPLVRCRRRPSGCLIQELPNGYSKVTWIEHVEVDDRGVHNIYGPLVNSGLAFGAKRWVFTLDRQCERLASAMATNLPPTHDVANSDGKKKADFVKQLHERARLNIERRTEQYIKQANKGRHKLVFEPGDWVWLHMRKEKFPAQRRSKLLPRGDGPFQVLERINDNAYKLDLPVISSVEGKRSMLKLSERMVMSFCGGVSASNAHTWTTLSGSGADDVRVMIRKSVDDPGCPPGIVLSAATSFWLPVPPKRVFEFFRDEHSRNEWDILSNGGMIQEMEHIAIGRENGNCVSLLRVNTMNGSQNNMLVLQESCIDQTGSYVIYAPVDIVAMNLALGGGDPDCVPILPSGFSILPDGPNGEGGSGGSLLTVAFQILVDSAPNAKLSLGSVVTVNNLIACSVERIKAAVASKNL